MEQDGIISETTTRTMLDTTINEFQKYVEADAEMIDDEFWTMKHDLEILAVNVKDILEHPDNYVEREVDEPHSRNVDRLVCQLVYSCDADRNDEQANSKIRKLANLCANLEYIVTGRDVTHDAVIAIPEGVSIVADRHSDDKGVRDNAINQVKTFIEKPENQKDPLYIKALAAYGVLDPKAAHTFIMDFNAKNANDKKVKPMSLLDLEKAENLDIGAVKDYNRKKAERNAPAKEKGSVIQNPVM